MSRRGATVGGKRPRGFVLVATVWVLAALVLLADYVSGVVAADRERARLALAALRDDLDARGTEATLLYLLATKPSNHRGLLLEPLTAPALSSSVAPGTTGSDATITFAGEPYHGIGRVRFSLQDEAGLAAVNKPGGLYQVALRHAGVAQADIALLLPRLRDYMDRDETLLVGGAERADYAAAGLPPPANWFLVSPLEVQKVLGARTIVPAEAWSFLRRNTTSAFTVGVNFNTMPLAMLTAFLGGDEAAARRVAQHRERHVLADVHAVREVAGHDLSAYGDLAGVTVASRLRLALWPEGGRQRTIVGVALTPNAINVPWRKEYRYFEPASGGSESARALATPLFQST